MKNIFHLPALTSIIISSKVYFVLAVAAASPTHKLSGDVEIKIK